MVYWTVRPDGEKVKSRVKTASVGYAISTKAVGTDVRQDLTLEYKAKEGNGNTTVGFHCPQPHLPLV